MKIIKVKLKFWEYVCWLFFGLATVAWIVLCDMYGRGLIGW